MSEKRKPRPVQPTGNAAQFGTPLECVLSRLTNVKRNGKGYIASCPVPTHGQQRGDRNPSLSIAEGDNGGVVIDCKAGCRPEDVLARINLTWRDVMPPSSELPAIQKTKSRPAKPPPPCFATVNDAIASMEPKLGPVALTWEYLDLAGDLVGVVARWDTPKGKEIRPFRRTPRGWEMAGMAAPRPLYRLSDIAKSKRIYVTEGEKAADAIRSLGLTATTSAGACKAAKQTDWTPLEAKECVVLPDNDTSGEGYLGDVLTLFGALRAPPIAKVLRLPGLPLAGDAVEFINARRPVGRSDPEIRDEIERLANEAAAVPLSRGGRLRWRPFPVQLLPEPLRQFVQQQADAIGCDPSMVALPALASCAGAIGTTRQARIKRTWAEPAVLWCALVSPSGTMKSPAHDHALIPLQKAQERQLREYQALLEQFEEEWDRYESDLAIWKKKKWEERGERPKKPVAPVCIRYLVQDVTIEGLAPILLVNRRGVLLARDELAGWITGFNQYKAKGGSDVPNWLQLHRAGLLVIDRKTGPVRTIYVPGAAVSVCGTIQPRTLQNLLTGEFFEAGLPARLLLAAPPVSRKRWRDSDIEAATLASFTRTIHGLLALEHGESEEGEPVPIDIELSPEARQLYIDWYNENAGLIERADDDDMRAVLAKIECYAIRLALIIHCVKCVGQGLTPDRRIDRDSMATGQALARWFANEAERMYGLWNESDEDRELRKLAEKARRMAAEGDGAVSVRDWQRARSHNESKDAHEELHRLVAAGYGSWLPPRQEGPGRPTSPRYKPNDDSDTDSNPVPHGETGSIVSVRGVDGGTSVVADQQRAAEPPDDSDQRETEARRRVEHKVELGLLVEPSSAASLDWATKA